MILESLPTWATIFLAFGGSAFITLVAKDIYEIVKNRKKKSDTLVEEERQRRLESQIRTVVKDEMSNNFTQLKDSIREQVLDVKKDITNVKGDIALIKEELEKVKSDLVLTKEGIQVELRHDIRNSCRRCIDQGFKTPEDIEEVDAMHDRYEVLGTNGVTNSLYEEFKKLPTQPNGYKKPTRAKKSTKPSLVEDKK